MSRQDRWLCWTVDDLTYHATREEAEEYLMEWHEGYLADYHEAPECAGWVAHMVSEAEEIIEGWAEDDTVVGQELRERGFDYLIGGYRVRRIDAPGGYA